MHIQSIRSRHRACSIFPPLLDALLINARTVPALSESNSLHPALRWNGGLATLVSKVCTKIYIRSAFCQWNTFVFVLPRYRPRYNSEFNRLSELPMTSFILYYGGLPLNYMIYSYSDIPLLGLGYTLDTATTPRWYTEHYQV